MVSELLPGQFIVFIVFDDGGKVDQKFSKEWFFLQENGVVLIDKADDLLRGDSDAVFVVDKVEDGKVLLNGIEFDCFSFDLFYHHFFQNSQVFAVPRTTMT